jgi:SAM-dependent methyltransferase
MTIQPQTHDLGERLFAGVLGMMDVYMVHVGDRLGFYGPLAASSLSAAQLAAGTGTNERYVREWLEQQAATGIVEVETDGGERRYRLPAPHAEILLDRDSPNYMAAFARMMVGIVRPLPAVIDAFRTGEGVPYADYDADFCDGQGDMNRVQFVNFLASEWLPALPDVHARLQADPPARVADVACGTGWSSIAIARAYPSVQVDGLDLDEHSIELARRNAHDEDLEDRLRFELRDAADPALAGRYQLVTMFEALHDLSRPVEALQAMRALLADDGAVLIADERVEDTFTAPAGEVEGTVMRRDTLREYATAAGFSEVQTLPIENDFWRFYRLIPRRRGGSP